MKEPKELAVAIAEFLYSKKGENIQVLDVANLTSITEFFVIASAGDVYQRSSPQAEAMALFDAFVARVAAMKE